MTMLPTDPRFTTAEMEVLWLGDPDSSEPQRVGGKVANLSRMAAAFNVPPGFALSFTGAAAEVGQDALTQAYARLAELTGEDEPAVAVRSSAVDEDGFGASFAGQHETYLNVRGVAAIARAAERCIDSFFSERALDYRRLRGLPPVPERLAVLVQWLVAADASGVVFGANPVTHSRDEIVINSSWGLGESIVGGTVTPDTWIVSRDGIEPVEVIVADKRRMTVPVPDGTSEVGVPSRLASTPSLDEHQAAAIAALALDLEQEMGWPVDAEFAFGNGQLYLLQCRPITTLQGADQR
jgi:phosphoenolpyruvate synthase/pyruvate phosphate dikinase